MNRRSATSIQIASTAPNGQAPDRKPYAEESPQPAAKASRNLRLRASNAYMVIMKVSEATPKTVSMLQASPISGLMWGLRARGDAAMELCERSAARMWPMLASPLMEPHRPSMFDGGLAEPAPS